MRVQETKFPSVQVIFFLDGLFSWQKCRSKPQNGTISYTIHVVFHVVVLVRPRQPFPHLDLCCFPFGTYNCDRKNRETSVRGLSASLIFMARLLQIEFQGAIYHISKRMNEEVEDAMERQAGSCGKSKLH
jgi:hypothetical protein